jgi:hypothetical protein
VKVLFVGEGSHDIGESSPTPGNPRPARGTAPALARRIWPAISPESLSIAWREIHRFRSPGHGRPGRGYANKVIAAVLLSERKFGCKATIAVADRDGKQEREVELLDGAERARSVAQYHPVVWGIAVESIEAWTLGAVDAIAEVLGIDVQLVKEEFPSGVNVEKLKEQSGKPDHRPKPLLERIADLGHRQPSTEFRAAVAERTDIAVLERACPMGFQPFAERLRAAAAQTI